MSLLYGLPFYHHGGSVSLEGHLLELSQLNDQIVDVCQVPSFGIGRKCKGVVCTGSMAYNALSRSNGQTHYRAGSMADNAVYRSYNGQTHTKPEFESPLES